MAGRKMVDKQEGVIVMSNGVSRSSIGEYISAGGGSMLDISTQLRITEAELAIVKNEVSELVAEKATLEVQCKERENSWKFALHQLGHTIEQRNEALAQIESPVVFVRDTRSPELKMKKMKAPALRTELETCLQQLDTQTRVARQVEHERDKANDELDFAKAQITTLMMQYHDLLTTCTEVARARDKAVTECDLLRKELNRYDSDLHSAIETELGGDGVEGTDKEKALLQQIRLFREEKEHLQRTFQQSVDQYKRQMSKCNMERRQAATSADAIRALLQRRLESTQLENADLRSELRASGEMITQLKDQLAQFRIASHQGNGYNGEGSATSLAHDDTHPESQTSQGLLHLGSGNVRHIPPVSQDTGISLYNSKLEPGQGPSSSTELITPGNMLGGYRVSSARTRRHLYVPTASPFPEEPRENSSEEEEASWI